MRILLDVASGRRADSSLDRRAAGLSPPDRALCQEISFGALRWKLMLDDRLDRLLPRGLRSLPPAVRALLEVAAYQLMFLDRVPDYAVLDRAVDHVRELLPPREARGLTGVVNATLRNLAAAPDRAAPPMEEGSLEALAVATSHPAWLVARWIERFGAARARAILDADNQAPGLHLRPHAGRVTAGELVERLRAEGARGHLHPLDPCCVVLEGGDPAALDAYRQGLFAVQDVSAQIVGRLAADLASGLVVDLCAAPGGKAGAVVERGSARVVLAVDVSAVRLRRLRANAKRQALRLLAVAADARQLALREPADFVLADVPCLGTGTLRRRVDARWQKTPDALPGLVALQRGILERAADLLGPGGRLLYATCSLEREENEDLVNEILAVRGDLRLVDLTPHVPPSLRGHVEGHRESVLWITPEMGDCDGAFAAVLERAA